MSRVIPTARRIPGLQPGDPEWLRLITGSKIAAILGLSPWESPFSLWHRMKGTVQPPEQTDEQERGHYLEPVICQWWRDNHPEYRIRRTGSFVHRHRAWQAATPDRIATNGEEVIVLEAKTDANGEAWGEADTDEIPVYYRAQVIWTLDVLGLKRAHVPMLAPRYEWRNYVVDHDETDAEFMRDRARAFLRDLENGVAPPIDDHKATYRTVRELHPEIDDIDIEIPAEIADRYRAAHTALTAATAEKNTATALVAEALGSGHYAVDPDGQNVAVRVPGPRGASPYIKQCKPKKPVQKGIAA